MPPKAETKDKTYKVVKVTIHEDSSVAKYLRTSANKTHMAELLAGVKKPANWVLEAEKKTGRVIAAHPMVDGHPDHVDGRDWKLYVERGKGTVDRLLLTNRKYTSVADKKDPSKMEVTIEANAKAMIDTH